MTRVRAAISRWTVIAGGICGLLVWALDYDFFLNAGGPATPISNAILKALHLQYSDYPVPVVVPMLLLVISGAAAGAVLAMLLARTGRS